MICVYPADCTDFSTNGNGTLAPLSAEVTETLNGEYELTLVHPIDEAGKTQGTVLCASRHPWSILLHFLSKQRTVPCVFILFLRI